MASIKDIVVAESERADMPSCRKIHLFMEGSFWRAYEWRAWLNKD